MYHYCSRFLTSDGADRLESQSTSDESTQFGCIGHGRLKLSGSLDVRSPGIFHNTRRTSQRPYTFAVIFPRLND